MAGIETLDVRTRREWRRWLEVYGSSATEIWLVFHKRHTRVSCIEYEEAVEEALCFGWVDSLIRRLDDERYARKFTPRREDSRWSALNRKRYAKLQAQGLLATSGLERPPTGRSGDAPGGDAPSKSAPAEVPVYVREALDLNPAALRHFEALAPSYRRVFVAWIQAAKREETRQKRIREAVELLAAGRKLGLK